MPNLNVKLTKGTSVGRFLITKPMTKAEDGTVYKAYDPSLDREVVIKISDLRSSLELGDIKGANKTRDNLLTIAQSMANLADPNIVTIYEVGIIDKRVYLAMEMLKGMSLKDHLNPIKKKISKQKN